MNKKLIISATVLITVTILFFALISVSAPLIFRKALNKSVNGEADFARMSVGLSRAYVSELSITDNTGCKVIHVPQVEVEYNLFGIFSGKPLKCLKKIHILSPEFDINHSGDGSINISSLFKKSEGKSKKGMPDTLDLECDIDIENANVLFSDYSIERKPLKLEINNIFLKSSYLKEQNKSVISFKASENKPSKAEWFLNGDYSFSNPSCNISGGISSVDFSSWINVLAPEFGIKTLSGSSSVSLRCKGRGRTLRELLDSMYLKASISSKNYTFRIPMIGGDISSLNASFSASKNGVSSDRISGFILGAPFQSSFSISDYSKKNLSGKFSVENISHNKILKMPLLSKTGVSSSISGGKTNISGSLDGTLDNPSLKAFIKSENIDVGYSYIDDFSISLDATKKAVSVHGIDCYADGFRLKGNGWVFPESKKMLLSFHGNGCPSFLPPQVSISSAGCKFFVAGTFDNPIIAGELNAYGLSTSATGTSIPIGNADSGFLYSEGAFYLPDLRISGNSGSICSSAVYDIKDSGLSASVRADNYGVSLNGASSVIGGDISLAGTSKDPLMSADLSLKGSYDKYDASFNVPASASKDFVNFSAEGITCGMNIDTSGIASIPDKTFEAVFSIKDIDSSYFASPEEAPSIKADLTGSLLANSNLRIFSSDIFQSGKQTGKMSSIMHDDYLLAYAAFDKPEVEMPEKGAFSIAKGAINDAAVLISGGLDHLSAFGAATYNGTVGGIDLSAIDFGVYSDGQKVIIENISAIGSDGSAYISGVAEPDSADLKVSFSQINSNSIINNLDLSACGVDVKQFFNNPELGSFQGYAYLDSNISVRNRNVKSKNKLFLPNGFWKNEKIALFSTISTDKSNIALDHFDLAMGISHFTGFGYMGLRPNSPIALTIHGTRVNLSRVLAVSPYHDIDISGIADGEGMVLGTIKEPVIVAHISVANPNVLGQTAKSLSADMRSEKGVISLENMVINMPSGDIYGSGNILADGKVKMSLHSDSLRCSDIFWLKDYIDPSTENEGLISMNAEVVGTKENPSGIFSFKTTPISFNNNRFDSLSGKLAYNNGTVKIDSLSAQKGNEVYSASGNLTLRLPLNPNRRGLLTKFFTDVDIKLSMNNGRLESFSSLIPSKLSQGACSGSINGDIMLNMSTKQRKNHLCMDINAEKGSIYGFPFDMLSLKIDRSGRSIKDINIDFTSGNAFLKVSGKCNGIDDDDKIVFKSKNFNLESIHPFLIGVPEKFLPNGKCDADGFIRGSLRSPDIESKLYISNASLGGVPLGNIEGKFTTDQTMMFVDYTGEIDSDLAIVPNQPSIIINGNENGNILAADVNVSSTSGSSSFKARIPFGFEKFMFHGKGDMIGGIKADYANLALLGIFMPLNGPADGNLSADIRFAGTYPNISIVGEAAVNNGSFTHGMMKNPIKNLNGSIHFKNHEVVVDEFSGTFGGGGFKAAGSADITGMKINKATAIFYASDMDIICAELFSGKVSGNIELNIEGDKKKLSGNTSIKDSVFSVSPSMLVSNSGSEEEKLEDSSDNTSKTNGYTKEDAIQEIKNIYNLKKGTYSDEQPSSVKKQEDTAPFSKYIPDFFKGTELAINADVGNGVWGTFLSSQLQIKGNVNVMGVLENPDILGNIKLSKGNIAIPLVSAPFKLKEGTLEFKGKGFLPELDIVAESNYDDYTAYLTVTGNAAEPKIKIEGSSSYYSDSNDYSGSTSYSASSLTSMSNKYLTNKAVSSLIEFGVMSPIMNALNRSIGISDVAVEFNAQGYLVLRFARSLDKKENIFLTYEYSPDTNGVYRNLIGMEYRYKRGMRIRVAQDVKGSTCLWIQENRKF